LLGTGLSAALLRPAKTYKSTRKGNAQHLGRDVR
jgi:hypothetical protein